MRTITRAYKTEIAPNADQVQILRQWCGISRFVWNRALHTRSYMYERHGARMYQQYAKLADGTVDKTLSLQSLFPWLKKQSGYEWLSEAPSSLILAALLDQDRAMSHFFRRLKSGEKPGYPRYKKRHVMRFRLYGGVAVEDRHVKLPKIGRIKLKERGYVQAGERIISAAVSERAGRWYVSVAVEEPIHERLPDGLAVAAHPGVREFLTIRDESGHEERIENRRALAYYQKRLRRVQRKLARQKRGSANRRKTVLDIQKIHARIADVRSDATHKATHHVTRGLSPGTIVIQQWRVREMLESANGDVPKWLERRIKQGISDANFAEVLRQVRYKADWYGNTIIEIDPQEPISKRCSSCGEINHGLGMKQTFVCPSCGVAVDRETNATINMLAALYSDAVEV